MELLPDAWERFERAFEVVAKSGPKHRTAAPPKLGGIIYKITYPNGKSILGKIGPIASTISGARAANLLLVISLQSNAIISRSVARFFGNRRLPPGANNLKGG